MMNLFLGRPLAISQHLLLCHTRAELVYLIRHTLGPLLPQLLQTLPNINQEFQQFSPTPFSINKDTSIENSVRQFLLNILQIILKHTGIDGQSTGLIDMGGCVF